MSSSPQASTTSEVKSETGDSMDVQVHTNEQSVDDLLEPIQNAAEENEMFGIDSRKPKRRRKKNSTNFSRLSYSARKMREIRSRETFVERQARLEKAAARATVIRSMETPEQRMKRNKYHRDRMRARRRVQKHDRSQLEALLMQSMKCLQEMDYNTRKKKVIELHEQGASIDSIAKKLQLASRTVFHTLKQYQMEKIAAESEVYVIDDDSDDGLDGLSEATESLQFPAPTSITVAQSAQTSDQKKFASTYYSVQPQVPIQTSIQALGNPPPVILNHQFRKRTGYKRKRKIEKPDEEAVINKQGEQVGVYRRIRNVQFNPQNGEPFNSSLELGLKILAAAVPPEVHETLLGKGVIPAAPNLNVKPNSNLIIKPVVGSAVKTQEYAAPVPMKPVKIEETKTTLSVRNVSLTTIQNVLNNNPGIKITSVKAKTPVLQQNKSVEVQMPEPAYNLHGGLPSSDLPITQISTMVPTVTPAVPVVTAMPTALSTIPKIAAVHSQFTPEALKGGAKTSKLDQILKDIEDNPVMYLGVGKEELTILSFLASCFQIHKKQIYVIFRKMRQNESVEILADVFEMPLEEVVTTIIDVVPRMAMLFKKTMKIASKGTPTDCALTRMKISVRKPNYMNDHPEEISRYSTSVDLCYVISCTHTGFINFVSKGFDADSKYSNSNALFHFSKSVNSTAAFLIGDGFGKIDLEVLKWKQIEVKTDTSVCYKMNVVKALDDIKLFKILADSEIPLRYEFFKIIDDLVIVASTLHNLRTE